MTVWCVVDWEGNIASICKTEDKANSDLIEYRNDFGDKFHVDEYEVRE